jgi:hypothetical protein
MADQIATVSKQRLKSRLATLSLDDVCAVERAVCVQLVSFPAAPSLVTWASLVGHFRSSLSSFLPGQRGVATFPSIEVAHVFDEVRDLARHLPEDYRRIDPGVE